MDSWADRAGFSEGDILSTVQRHMLDEHGEGLRFALTYDDEHAILLRVLPERARKSAASSTRALPSIPEEQTREHVRLVGKMTMSLDDVTRTEAGVPPLPQSSDSG